MSEKKVMKLNLNKETVEILSAKSMVNIVGGAVGDPCNTDDDCAAGETCLPYSKKCAKSLGEPTPPVSDAICSKSVYCQW